MKQATLFSSIAGAFAIAGAVIASPAAAGAQDLPASVAAGLDRQPVEYSMTAAKERRLMIMQETMRQQRYGRGGYGYGRGYGPRPHYGYGPGYGPRPGYGYRRGYYERW
ncbi:hypothetical protein FQV39_13915 [Bosea sp. F3-2]|jgi:hypothetical protein|uniref:hypothetical protein n=1 Tax=Bosea sp. F3-2 TaxID=2599640 RepID=UPI0011ECB824|nr:hypothetical protein [Bosea sp. F3-2]QEL23557.1 hypothetical protein FQV39_13915 [Bosea sp. F3-2]